jgi:phage terminase small subunit
MDKKDKLTPQQRRFVVEYLKDFNATRAAIAAGYSEKTATSQGSRLLRNVNISHAIGESLQPGIMSANEVLFHLAEVARADIADVTDDDGSPDLAKARRLGKTRLIRKVSRRTTQNTSETSLELHDKVRSLALLAKYHNLTNTLQVADWRSDAVSDIRAGRISFQALAAAFDVDLARELFAAAGVPLADDDDTGESEE